MTSTLTLNANIIKKLLNVVDQGLIIGLGEAIPGKMCVEAAVCYALGLEHGDDPKCVGSAIRQFKITLNDQNWTSDFARADGMRRLAVAQLGSNLINQEKFAEKLVLKTINILLPKLFRLPVYNGMLESHAITCENVENLRQGYIAADAAEVAAKIICAYAAYAADAAADAANYAAYAAYATDATADVVASAVAAAAYAAYAADATRNYFLKLIASLALEVLQEMKSPGTEWLYLCEAPNHD